MDQPRIAVEASFTSNYSTLVPFNYEMRSYGRDILYRSTKDQNILKLIDRDIGLPHQQNSTSFFKSKEAIIITFNNVRYYDYRNILFRYQVVIASDYNSTYTIFNYDRLDRQSYDNIGYVEPDATFSCTPYKRFNLNRNNLTKSSNVGQPGKFVFRLTDDCNEDKGKGFTVFFVENEIS